jgi:hypothetical protein
MYMLVSLLSYAVDVGALICLILVLIKMFPAAGTTKGIIGIVTCGIYALIWGWQNKDTQNLDKIVKLWTALIGVWIVLFILLIILAPHVVIVR